MTHNAALGQRDGVPKEKFAALADYTTNPLFSDLERLVIRYAEEMTEKVQVDSRLVEELRKQLGPEALVQLTLSIAAANFTNRFNEALGTELETLSRGDPMSKLNQKVALITGGSRGIGAAIAKRLAADGASVAITYAKEASAAFAVVKAIELSGGKAVAIHADAVDTEAVKGAVEKTLATLGRLDVLVNNAGTAIPKTCQ